MNQRDKISPDHGDLFKWIYKVSIFLPICNFGCWFTYPFLVTLCEQLLRYWTLFWTLPQYVAYPTLNEVYSNLVYNEISECSTHRSSVTGRQMKMLKREFQRLGIDVQKSFEHKIPPMFRIRPAMLLCSWYIFWNCRARFTNGDGWISPSTFPLKRRSSFATK